MVLASFLFLLARLAGTPNMSARAQIFDRKWLVMSDVLLAVVFGATLVLILDALSGGLLISVAMTSAFLAVTGLLHYWLWGRAMSRGTATFMAPSMIKDTFLVELNDDERVELLSLLKSALQGADAVEHAPKLNGNSMALRKSLAEKLQRYGA
jgi:hypothetical protein